MSERGPRDAAPSPVDERQDVQQRTGARRTALLLLLLMLVVGGVAFYYLWNVRAVQVTRNGESVNVLLVGAADGQAEDVADALVVASFHPVTKAVEVVVLPAQTVLPWAATDGPHHLRDVYAGGGLPSLKASVERLLAAPMHHTVRVDYSGFVELVDLLGGVPVPVAEDVLYRDGEGNVTFHLEPGLHRLNGEAALHYIRYKGVETEEQRVARQRRFIEAVLVEARQRLGWDKVQPLLRIALNHVSTDMDLTAATSLVRIIFDGDRSVDALHMLPGTDDGEGWMVNVEQAAALSRTVFHNPSWPTATE